MPTRINARQNLTSPRVTAVEIADIALRLCELSVAANAGNAFLQDPKQAFREYFAFAFDLLVDAEFQLQQLPREKQTHERIATRKDA